MKIYENWLKQALKEICGFKFLSQESIEEML